jgi:AcrR family transcriptional regulator
MDAMETAKRAAGARSKSPTQRRPRGSYAKTPERRFAILDAALAVFAERGYRAGSLRDVAERVGMSEAGLLHHFPNKSSLLAAVLERRDERSYEIVPLRETDGIETIVGLVRLAEYNASVPGVVELYCALSAEATSPDHPAHAYFVERYALVRDRLRIAFENIEADGLLVEDITPEHAARSTIALMDGLQVQWLLDRSSLDMAEELRIFFRRITHLEPEVLVGEPGSRTGDRAVG